MRQIVKALLFSALVFPGSGQFMLKRYKSSALFICTSFIFIILIGISVFKKAVAISDKIIAGEIPADYMLIRQMLIDQQANSDSQYITIIIYSLIGIWLINIIDILRLQFTN